MAKNLTALKRLHYGGKALNAGDDFTASDRDAHIFIGIGKAKAAAPKQAYQTRMMSAEPVAVAPVAARENFAPPRTVVSPRAPAKKAATKRAPRRTASDE